MKKIKLFLSIFVAVLISSFCVFASDDAPPAIPAEYYGTATVNGAAAADGLAVTGEVDGVNYAQSSQTLDGYYNIILVDGDRELTYNDDKDCATHWSAGEACVPCVDEADCIEGPQDGDIITLKIDGSEVMPLCLSWAKGEVTEIEAISPIGDWSKNGCVNLASDFPYFGAHYEFICSDPGWELIYDLNCDCNINLAGDFPVFATHYEEGCGG